MGDPADDLAPGEVAIAVVDDLELAAIDSHTGPLQHTDAAAQFDELSADPADRRTIVAAEIGDGLVIGASRPVSHITSTFRPASRSSRRLDGIRFR